MSLEIGPSVYTNKENMGRNDIQVTKILVEISTKTSIQLLANNLVFGRGTHAQLIAWRDSNVQAENILPKLGSKPLVSNLGRSTGGRMQTCV